jgi:hypothetical protein
VNDKRVNNPVLSDAEVIERVRVKIKCGEYFFDPQVSANIELLRKAKKRQAAQAPDRDYRTTIDLDLLDAILTGTATEIAPLTTEPYWSLAVKGMDNDGFPLVVNVYLHYEESEPLYIWSFVHCEKGEE